MNEDDRGITPPEVTALTIERTGTDWRVVIEQGNGAVIKTLDLTEAERTNLALMLDFYPGGNPVVDHIEFVDVTRHDHRA